MNTGLSKRSILFVLTAFLLLVSASWGKPVSAQTPTPEEPVIIYLFWGEGCPHCAIAKPYFENLAAQNPAVTLKTFEVFFNEDNQQLFAAMAQEYGLEYLGVPTIFIGQHYLQGYAEELNESIEATIRTCMESGCIDPKDAVVDSPLLNSSPEVGTSEPASAVDSAPDPASDSPAPQSTLVPDNRNEQVEPPRTIGGTNTLNLPLIGSVSLDLQPIALSTALIALVDGFNPCSLWVLSMLLALTLHTGSRKKVLLVGLIFITVTAGIYALFIAGLFSVLKAASFMGWIRVIVALVALFFALINIKDYFWFKEGISFTISDEGRSGIFKRIRAILDASQSFWGLAGATIVMAAGVSVVEFSCTAGFPVIWVNLLNSQNVSGSAFVLLLLLYMLIYQADELVIFLSAVATLKASRLEEKHGRILKLMGGMLLLTLAVVMLIDPTLMNSLGSSLMIFGAAFGATLMILLIHRVLLPRCGIQIGSRDDT